MTDFTEDDFADIELASSKAMREWERRYVCQDINVRHHISWWIMQETARRVALSSRPAIGEGSRVEGLIETNRRMVALWSEIAEDGPEGNEPLGEVIRTLSKTTDALEALSALRSPPEPERPCTCHPDDNPPVPCARQYAMKDCRLAAVGWTRQGLAKGLALLDGVTLQDIKSTVGPEEDANNWRKYLGRADDLLNLVPSETLERCNTQAEPVAWLRPVTMTWIDGSTKRTLYLADEGHDGAFPVYASPPSDGELVRMLTEALRSADEWMSCVEGQLRDGQTFKRDREAIRAALRKASESD